MRPRLEGARGARMRSEQKDTPEAKFQEPWGREKGMGEKFVGRLSVAHQCTRTTRAAGKARRKRRRILNQAAGKWAREGENDPLALRRSHRHTVSPGDGQSKKEMDI